MAMRRTEGMVKKMVAGAALEEYQMVKLGTTDDQVLPCDDDDEVVMGVTLQKAKVNEFVDVQIGGIAEVKYGATVARGAKVSPDASGHAITAVATGHVLGIATVAGVDNDIGCVLIDRDKLET